MGYHHKCFKIVRMASNRRTLDVPAPSKAQLARCQKNPLKPPTFRGSDFTMRWAQGRWSEDRIIEAINATRDFRALSYGRSKIGPEDRSELKAYWSAYASVENHGKRPDILVLNQSDYRWAKNILGSDPTTAGEKLFAPIVKRSICGIEAENSLWIAKQMPDFTSELPLRKLNTKSPNIWVKDQDLPCLLCWMHHHRKPIIVAQVFYDVAYAISLLDIVTRIRKIQSCRAANKRARQKDLGVVFRKQNYSDSRTGTTQTKLVYVTHHSLGVLFGQLRGTVRRRARTLVEQNGKILPYVAFEGGRLRLTRDALRLFREFV